MKCAHTRSAHSTEHTNMHSKMLRIFAYLIIVVIMLIFISTWPYRSDGRASLSSSSSLYRHLASIHIHIMRKSMASWSWVWIRQMLIIMHCILCTAHNTQLAKTWWLNWIKLVWRKTQQHTTKSTSTLYECEKVFVYDLLNARIESSIKATAGEKWSVNVKIK